MLLLKRSYIIPINLKVCERGHKSIVLLCPLFRSICMNNRKLTSLLLTVLSISVFSIVGANSIDDSVTGDIRKEA